VDITCDVLIIRDKLSANYINIPSINCLRFMIHEFYELVGSPNICLPLVSLPNKRVIVKGKKLHIY
jgi:hypothetical protein